MLKFPHGLKALATPSADHQADRGAGEEEMIDLAGRIAELTDRASHFEQFFSEHEALRILAGLGVEEVPGEGEAFDPRYHEAVGLLPGEPGKVAKVFQRGFRMGEALVRPARVAVGEEKQEEADLE